jgi:hypothetical protein
MLNEILAWLGAVGIPLAIYFYFRQKIEGRKAAEKTERMSEELTHAHAEITGLRETTERSVRQSTPVHVLLEQTSRAESVNRPEYKSKVLGLLLVNKPSMVVVHGEFGAGKTWLAREIGRIAIGGENHFSPFPHGLLSATLGSDSVVQTELEKWRDAVEATYVPVIGEDAADGRTAWPESRQAAAGPGKNEPAGKDATDVRDADGTEYKRLARRIESQLIGRYPLVVIDDAWRYADVKALLAAVPERPVLVTTREPDVVENLIRDGAGDISLLGLTPEQAVQLLRELVGPALDDASTDKLTAFLTHLSERIALDPYTVVQTGAALRDLLQAQGGSWRTISQQRLDELARAAESWRGLPGRKDGDGRRVFQKRLQSLSSPLQLAVLRTLSLLRPRPEAFTAEEVAALCLRTDDAEPGGPASRPPAVGDTEDALQYLDKACYVESSRDEFTYSLHNLSRNVLAEAISAQVTQDFHRAAVKYWRSWVDPRDPDTHVEGSTSYQIAINREGADWLRAARNLVYHLSRLDDRAQARQTFTAIYFELFFWWGFYLRYPPLEEFVRDWETMARAHGDPLDKSDEDWFAAILDFHHGYPPGHPAAFSETRADWLPSEPDYRGESRDWPAVTEALKTILRLTGMDGPISSLGEHDQWHTRALIDTFLADSYRYRPRARRFDSEVDSCYAEARSLVRKCNEYDADQGRKPACDWLLSWIDREASDEALRRALDAPDHATRTSQLELAQAWAAAALRAILAGDDPGTLTTERAELDYETIALACLTYGDACVQLAELHEAAHWYAAAVVLAAAWNYRPVTDDYTCAFCGHVSEHVRRAVRDLLDPDAAAPQRRDGTAVLHRVLMDGHACGWGSEIPGITRVNPAVVNNARGFMSLLIGPLPAPGKHDGAGDMPATLDQATERMLAQVWQAARRTADAGAGTGAAAASDPHEPVPAG